MKMRIVLILISAALAGCGNTLGVAGPDPERVLLEVEYINFAWTPTYFGFIVELDGEVYKYDRQGAEWNFERQESFTKRELRDKFSLNRTLLQTRSTAEADNVATKVDQLSTGPLSPRKAECADAGVLTYRAYKYDSIADRYQPVLLRAEGDVAQQNTSTTAQELIAYIRSLELIEELLGCDP